VFAAEFWQPLDKVTFGRTDLVAGPRFLTLLSAASGFTPFSSAADPFLIRILMGCFQKM
jgi:hypothetical protein